MNDRRSTMGLTRSGVCSTTSTDLGCFMHAPWLCLECQDPDRLLVCASQQTLNTKVFSFGAGLLQATRVSDGCRGDVEGIYNSGAKYVVSTAVTSRTHAMAANSAVILRRSAAASRGSRGVSLSLL